MGGSRKLLLYGTSGIVFCHILLGVSFLPEDRSIAFFKSIKIPLAFSSLLGFIFFWDISWAALMFVVIAEVLPNVIRGIGTGFAIGVFWTLNFIVGEALELFFNSIPPYEYGEHPQKHP